MNISRNQFGLSRKEWIFMDNNYQAAGNYSNHFNQFTPTVFNNPLFGNLTVLKDINGNLWFIGVEVARMLLGYKEPKLAIKDLVPYEMKFKYIGKLEVCETHTSSWGGSRVSMLINEQGLMNLITHSRLNNSTVVEFQHWLYDVAVSMRQYGVAMSDQMKTVMELDPYKLYDIAQQRLNENVELQERLKMQQEAIDKRTEQYNSSLADNYKLQYQLKDTINDLKQARNLKYNEEVRNDRLRDEISELRGALEVIMKVASTKVEESY